MKKVLVIILLVFSINSDAQEKPMLWYLQPAKQWTEALPIGNGRLAAMAFGKTGTDQFQLNEETIWAGTKVDDINPGAKANLKKIQQLLFEEKNKEAYELTKKHLLGTPPEIRSYQTLGDFFIDWLDSAEQVTEYRRSLDLSTSIHTTNFNRNKKKYTVESFISAPADLMVIHIKAATAKLNLNLRLTRERDALVTAKGKRLLMTGRIKDETEPLKFGPAGDHLRFASLADIRNSGGTVSVNGNHLEIRNADEILILFTAASDYKLSELDSDPMIDPGQLCETIIGKSSSASFTDLKTAHLLEFQPLFNTASFELGGESHPELPTDQRLTNFNSGIKDAGLIPLYFQFGRYLLLSSSRYPAKLPANLQGKWNPHFNAPWQSDYHTNINLQMNYWPADVANVSIATKPLAAFMDAMLEPGKICAEKMYGASGWAMHHTTDIYGRTAINTDPIWATSPLAGAWMALSIYDHYDFTRDREYLRNYAFPIMKASADFILDFLVTDPAGQLVTAPSMSPENGFFLQGDSTYRNVVTYGPAIDIQIIRELFHALQATAAETGLSLEYTAKLKATEMKLPPTKINRYGGIQEWIKDYDEQEPGHRHMSQLFGLYPGTSLTKDSAFLKAARITIEHRLKYGGGHTGWSRAWMINFYARLKDSQTAYYHLSQLLNKSTLSNLFDNHPPFQIDGNFGGTAGIAEMLIQSHNGKIELLPALPAEWATGKIVGLKARGGYVLELAWDKGRLISGKIFSTTGEPVIIRYQGKEIKMAVPALDTREIPAF